MPIGQCHVKEQNNKRGNENDVDDHPTTTRLLYHIQEIFDHLTVSANTSHTATVASFEAVASNPPWGEKSTPQALCRWCLSTANGFTLASNMRIVPSH